MLKKSMCYSMLAITIAGFIILASGFYQALMVTTKVSPQPWTTNTHKLLILGDSIAKGTGDEKNQGFSDYLPELLKSDTSKEIIVDNAGIDGLESMGLLEQLQTQRFERLIAHSDIILISIGGNDLRSILSQTTLTRVEAFKFNQERYLSNLKQIIKELRNINSDAIVIFLGLYNPYEELMSVEDTRLLDTWNYSSEQLIIADKKAIYIPTYDLIKYNVERYIAQDGLHPNSSGYQAISNRIGKSVEIYLEHF